jgi:2-polyprenyl-3-methyl-5-hydroxy-6-metoxy-1,4-benzoquinol methylase
MIQWAARSKRVAILDIGGGASTLVDDLVAQGYEDVTLLDIAETAVELARLRMGESANTVRWVTADFLDAELEPERYDICHDRAVFHFLTDAAEQQKYFDQVDRILRPKGALIVETFAMEGPEQCSGLIVSRYNEDAMRQAAGDRFEIAASQRESHHTPSGGVQEMMCFVLRRPPMPR